MLTEGDVIITNLTVSIEEIVQKAQKAYGDREPHVILNIGKGGNINTGTYFIRNSPSGRLIMDRMSVIRTEYASDRRVTSWGANGAMMIAMLDKNLSAEAAFLPWQVFNAYSEWKPGYFMRHFAGSYPKSPHMEEFVKRYPPEFWPGWRKETYGSIR